MKSKNFKKCLSCSNWNLILAGLYFVQAIVIYLFIDTNLTRPLDVTFLSENLLGGQLQTTVKTIYDLDFKSVLLILPSIAGLFHLVYGLKPQSYKKVLLQRVNVWRWLISGLMSGLVLALTALILGVSDVAYLLLLVVAMLGFGWMGLLTEYLKAHIEPAKKRSTKVEQKNEALKQLLGLVTSLKRMNGLLPHLMVGISLVSGYLLATQTYDWRYSLIYLNSLFLIIIWLMNAAADKDADKKPRNYSSIESVYMGSSLIFISVWVWLVALIGT